MEFSEEWKSLWPISSVFSPPLFISNSKEPPKITPLFSNSKEPKKIGPLIFNPIPQTLTKLFFSPSLSPSLPPSFPNLSLPRFLRTFSPQDPSILLSTSSSISSTLGPQISPPTTLTQNPLQLMKFPGTHLVLAFFPTGNNSDRVGFLVLSKKDSVLVASGFGGEVFMAKNALNHRITHISANPFGDLLVCTMYSVNWYGVRASGERFELEFLDCKVFKSCGVVYACWNPHLREECLVLLESGEMFLFDLDCVGLNRRVSRKKLKVLWDYSVLSEKGRWLGCEFSWHPRILIVAYSNTVFLVDLRPDESVVSCLLKIEMLVIGNFVNNDSFVALSRAGSDGFYFTVASNKLLVLCDVRKPLMPLLQWSHNIHNPRYMTVFKLSDLRSYPKDNEFNWASESGNCILLGSFWNSEFSLFCYGPDNRGPSGFEISKHCKSFYAWGLPSELSLSTHNCRCGSCLVREEFSKDSLSEWIDWRQKKEIVLGFGILDKDLSSEIPESSDSFGGFTLVRLTSSGKLESQKYQASWEFQKIPERTHVYEDSSLQNEDSLLYDVGDTEYKLTKKYNYLKLDCLKGYLKGNLGEVLVKKIQKIGEGSNEKFSFASDFHKQICQKLKVCGLSRLREPFTVYDSFKDVNLPTSVHEIAVRRVWASLPIDLLRLAFSTYPEFLEILVNNMNASLEFLDIPEQPHLPPFSFRKPSRRSSKWSQKVQRGNGFVGPVVPLQFLVTLNELRTKGQMDKSSADLELKRQSNKVMRVAKEVTKLDSDPELDNYVPVCLADDQEEMFDGSKKTVSFSLHKPVALSYSDPTLESSLIENEAYTMCVYRTRKEELVSNAETKMVGLEIFDNHCPSELRFDDRELNFGSKELQAYNLLKKQQSNFEKGFNLYQDYLTRSNFQRQRS